MKSDGKFRSYADHCFKNSDQSVRAFLYSDYYIEPHDHDFYEMNVVFRGEGTHLIEGSRLLVRTGDVFVIPPNTVHAYCDTRDLDVFHVLFRNSFVAENREEAVGMPGFLQLVEIEPFLRKSFSSPFFLHLSASKLSKLRDELSLIQDGGEFDRDELEPLKNHTAWKIIYQLSYQLFRQLETKGDETEKYESNIIKALEHIHQHYGEKITVDSLCKTVFLSRSTFLRNFSSICGCTPVAYLNSYRAKKALEMIEAGGFSKTETAHACGFYDLSHMERVLKNNKRNIT